MTDDLFELRPVADLSNNPVLMRVSAETARVLMRSGKAVLVNPERDLLRLDLGSAEPVRTGPRQVLFTR